MNPTDKTVNCEMFTELVLEIEDRIPVMQEMYKNKKLRFHFTIEGRNMIEEWNIFYPTLKKEFTIVKCDQEDIVINYNVYCKASYFIYFFSLPFQSGDDSDKLFYAGAEIYLKKYFNKTTGEPFDHLKFYKNAFPIPIKPTSNEK